jgi:hypothetical protein
MSMSGELVPVPGEITQPTGVDALLRSIRPHWQAKNLIERVKRLLPADPSSACQRIFNASIHDLKEKLCVAGLDIVGEAARLNKLPAVTTPEDIERYSTYNTIVSRWFTVSRRITTPFSRLRNPRGSRTRGRSIRGYAGGLYLRFQNMH